MKFKIRKGDEKAISAVIGVILMVAITVAIAAVSYAYLSGLIGAPDEETPIITFSQDDENNEIIVLNADPNIEWSHIELTGGGTAPATGFITAGDKITNIGSGTPTITIRWKPSNTLLGTYEFTEG